MTDFADYPIYKQAHYTKAHHAMMKLTTTDRSRLIGCTLQEIAGASNVSAGYRGCLNSVIHLLMDTVKRFH